MAQREYRTTHSDQSPEVRELIIAAREMLQEVAMTGPPRRRFSEVAIRLTEALKAFPRYRVRECGQVDWYQVVYESGAPAAGASTRERAEAICRLLNEGQIP